MPDTITTRAAKFNDLPDLLALWQDQHIIELQLDPNLAALYGDPADDLEDAESDILDALSNKDELGNQVIVAERDGKILGYVHLWLWDITDEKAGCRIEALVIDPHDGHGGIGTALLDAVMDRVRAHGGEALSVTVPRHVAVQQAFWRAKGAFTVQEVMVLRVKP